ncbi:MAG: PASTA domain-containing protein [Ekhidna sp.]
MSFWKPASIKDFLIHLAVILGTAFLVVVIVFYVWLPISTNHGESITVPDVKGMTLDELDDFLEKRDLRFEVTPDSSYSPDFPPLAVLRQVPKPNAKVKENRKIYVTINAETPPLVKMPRLEDASLKAAQMTLKSYDLKLGNIKYVSDAIFGVVHEGRMNGREVLEGEKVPKGSTIDLIVGDGRGNTVFQSPMLLGLDQEEAEFVIIGSGLKVGKIQNTGKTMAGFYALDTAGREVIEYRAISPGTIQQQYPRPERILRIGDPVDLWIYMPDSVSNSETILDNQ